MPASALKRLLAIVYDLFLLFGVLFLAGLPLPLIPEIFADNWLTKLLTQLYLLSIMFCFFGWFWTHGGQTLGMRAWRLQLVNLNGERISWLAALKRFAAAIVSFLPVGLGFFWMLVHPEKRTWHDLFSQTYIVQRQKSTAAKS